MGRRTRPSASPHRCGACGQPVIRQHVEVLTVTVNADPIPAGTDEQHRDPHHLTWCAPPEPHSTSPPRLRWIYGWHADPCPHPHHAEHRCTPRTTQQADPQQAAQPSLF